MVELYSVGCMDKTNLSLLISSGMNQVAIAKHVGRSQPTVRKWLIRFGLLKTKVIYRCSCGQNDPSAFKSGIQYECKRCLNRRKRKKPSHREQNKLKAEMVVYKGGGCQHVKNGKKCGYNSCLAALDFHHVDPKSKDPKCKSMWRWPLVRLKAELDKCVLVCKNCHMEIHYGVVA